MEVLNSQNEKKAHKHTQAHAHAHIHLVSPEVIIYDYIIYFLVAECFNVLKMLLHFILSNNLFRRIHYQNYIAVCKKKINNMRTAKKQRAKTKMNNIVRGRAEKSRKTQKNR